MNPSTSLRLVLVGSTSQQSPNCDPALDILAPGAAARLSAYERTRSDADRDALPLRPDARPSVFVVQPLTSAGMRLALDATGVRRAQNAVLIACHAFTDALGVEHRASDHGGLTSVTKGVSIASDDWLDHLADLYGAKAITEIAAVVVQRAEVGPLAVAPFLLPLGLMLAR